MATASDVCGFCFEQSVYGFCENCSQRLCSSCFATHSRASRHNTFQINSKCDAVSREVDIHEQKCPRHKTDFQSLYCSKHDATLCGRCIRSDHLGCGDSIIDLYDITVGEDCLNESRSALKQSEREVNEIKAGVLENYKSNDVCKVTYLNSIKEYRKTIDARLDQLQSIIESAGERKHEENNRALRAVEEKMNETLRFIQERTDLINELTDKNMRRYLYIVSRRQEKEIININATIRQSKLDNHVENFMFAKNSKLENILHNEIQEFGTRIEECAGSEEIAECESDTQNKIAEGVQWNIPNIEEQKDFVAAQLDEKRPLIKGEIWYMLDAKWYKQWKSYVGFDTWDNYNVGEDSANPGHIDNSPLFEDDANTKLKEHLIETLNYILIPAEGWYRLVAWYSMAEGQEPLPRKVIEEGEYSRDLAVEVYPWQLKLAENSTPDNHVIMQFSGVVTIEQLEVAMRREFNINEDKEVRLWYRYMTNLYEPLNNKKNTLHDAGLCTGQIVVIEQKNDDGTWPRAIPVPVNKK